MTQWIKKQLHKGSVSFGIANLEFNEGVEYCADDNKTSLALYSSDEGKSIVFIHETGENFYHQLKKDLPFNTYFEHGVGDDSPFNNARCLGILKTLNQYYLCRLIDEINKRVNFSLNEHYEEIKKFLGIRKSEVEIRAEVFNLIKDTHGIQKAIALAVNAQSEGYYEVVWELAEHFYQKGLEQMDPHNNNTSVYLEARELYKFYQKISEQNPHFKTANARLYDLMMSQPVPQDEDTKIIYVEEKLRWVINADYPQQMRDQIFHELCGYTGLQPITPNIKGDANTLIALAKHIRELNKQNKELKNYIAKIDASRQVAALSVQDKNDDKKNSNNFSDKPSTSTTFSM